MQHTCTGGAAVIMGGGPEVVGGGTDLWIFGRTYGKAGKHGAFCPRYLVLSCQCTCEAARGNERERGEERKRKKRVRARHIQGRVSQKIQA
jgi:hypothetical protein